MRKLVYLDSSDFSDLSAPEEQLSADNQQVLRLLKQEKERGAAQFLLSAVHLVEAVHSGPAHKQAAVRRATLMGLLCDSDRLRFPDVLYRLELQKALTTSGDGRLTQNEFLSPSNEFFGLGSPFARTRKDLQKRFQDKFDSSITHLPRRDRRRLKSEWSLTKASGRDRWRARCRSAAIVTQDNPDSLLDSKLLIDVLLGDRNDNDLSEAVTGRLNDPITMIDTLDVTGEREEFCSLFRKEGQERTARLRKRMEVIVLHLRKYVENGIELPSAKFMRDQISKDELLRGLIEDYGPPEAHRLSEKEVRKLVAACPALSLHADTLLAYAYSLVDANKQRLMHGKSAVTSGEASDFSDLMHAAYAPYVDVIRCDAGFGALLKQHISVRKKVVDRRYDLVRALGEPGP